MNLSIIPPTRNRGRLALVPFAAIAAAFPGAAMAAGGQASAPQQEIAVSSTEAAHPVTADLNAGPIHLKFADGELRYLYVGDKEIVRRIYFAVRNGHWATSAPVFTQMDLHRRKDGFSVDLKAVCQSENVDYRWSGHIEGTPDGKIAFHAAGESGAAFRSLRIGLCVLYGAGSLAGQKYETIQDGQAAVAGMFPLMVSPELVSGQFNTLRYTTADGMTVSATVAGTRFDMEDQRTYGDSSFKAYAPLSYPYPEIPAATPAEETVTVQVQHPRRAQPQPKNLAVKIGGLLPNVKVPAIVIRSATSRAGTFFEVNNRQERFQGAKTLTWPFTPSIHLLDDDAFMENTWSLPDQLKTAHTYAPGAVVTLDPVVINSRPGPGGDPRNAGAFGAAWSVAVVHQAALAGVSEARFALGPGAGETLQKELAAYAGRGIYDAHVEQGNGPVPVEVLAIDDNGKPVVWIANRTNRPVDIAYTGLGGRAKAEIIRLAPYAVVQPAAH